MRPRKISSPRQFDALAEKYFGECEAENKPVQLTGLILALGLSSRESLDEYGRREEFFDSVKKAKLMVEKEYEARLLNSYPAGAIFALKNFGWKDQQHVDLLANICSPASILEAVNARRGVASGA